MDRFGATQALEFALLQNAQQFGLQLERHVADFVQKQGSSVGLFEAPDALIDGAGESSP